MEMPNKSLLLLDLNNYHAVIKYEGPYLVGYFDKNYRYLYVN